MNKHKEKLKETYNKIADDWFRDHKDDVWWTEVVDKFIGYLGKGKTVLDIGCGAGVKSAYLSNHGLNVVGIDLSEKFIDFAKENCPSGDFSVQDMENIECKEKFDGVFAQASLLHARKKDAPDLIKKWTEFLKPGGYIYIGTKISNKGLDEEVIKENDYGYEYERFFSFYTRDEIETYMRDAGLAIVYSTVTFSGNTNWVQAIGKKEETE